jgi:hypothetical protein
MKSAQKRQTTVMKGQTAMQVERRGGSRVDIARVSGPVRNCCMQAPRAYHACVPPAAKRQAGRLHLRTGMLVLKNLALPRTAQTFRTVVVQARKGSVLHVYSVYGTQLGKKHQTEQVKSHEATSIPPHLES